MVLIVVLVPDRRSIVLEMTGVVVLGMVEITAGYKDLSDLSQAISTVMLHITNVLMTMQWDLTSDMLHVPMKAMNL